MKNSRRRENGERDSALSEKERERARERGKERRMDRQRNYSRMLRSGNGAFYCAFVIVKLSGQFCVGPIYAHVSRCTRDSPPPRRAAPKWHVMLDCIILQNFLRARTRERETKVNRTIRVIFRHGTTRPRVEFELRRKTRTHLHVASLTLRQSFPARRILSLSERRLKRRFPRRNHVRDRKRNNKKKKKEEKKNIDHLYTDHYDNS